MTFPVRNPVGNLPPVLSSGLLVLGIVSQCGCSTTRLPDYPSGSTITPAASSKSVLIENEGVRATLDPFADQARCQQYFGFNAPAAGIAILHLRIENQSGDTTWLLRKARCKLLLDGADNSLAVANTKRSTASGEAVAITGAALMGLATTPLFLAFGSQQVNHATTVQRNFTEKELRDKTLSPGQAEQGFLYYQMVQKSTAFTGRLELTLINTRDQQLNTLQIPINYEPN